jgi:hypothetical protein
MNSRRLIGAPPPQVWAAHYYTVAQERPLCITAKIA